jgi:haloacetate dehalogenase
MFEHFTRAKVAVSGVTINTVRAGQGPPVLLLHGWPQTLATWHKIAPGLARTFTVVATDLRGYGDSDKPESSATHEPYAKRTMAAEQIAVMRALGFEQFAVVGHDRGGRVAHRMALDHPDRVTKLAVLDIIPTAAVYEHVTAGVAQKYWHWFFLTLPAPIPETILGASAEFFMDKFLATVPPGVFTPEAQADYRRCFPAMIAPGCEDFRAGASIDLAHDRADGGRKVTCPTLALWGTSGNVQGLFDRPLELWRARASIVQGCALPCGHCLAEELPDQTLAELMAFLSA